MSSCRPMTALVLAAATLIAMLASGRLEANCSDERRAHVIDIVRHLAAWDMLYATRDMLRSEVVGQEIADFSIFPSFEKLVVRGAKPCYGSWPRAFRAILPDLDYNLYKDRREHWAHGGWIRALANLRTEYPINAASLLRNLEPRSRELIGEVVGERNAVTASTLYQYLDEKRRQVTLDFPKVDTWLEVLDVGGFDAENIVDHLPPMTDDEGIAIMKQIINEGFNRMVVSTIRFTLNRSFMAMARRAVGKPYSKYTFLNWFNRNYRGNVSRLFEDCGTTLAAIRARRRTLSDRVLVASTKFDTPDRKAVTAIESIIKAETLQRFYDTVNLVLAEFQPADDRWLANELIELLLDQPELGATELARQVSRLPNRRVTRQHVIGALDKLRRQLLELGCWSILATAS